MFVKSNIFCFLTFCSSDQSLHYFFEFLVFNYSSGLCNEDVFTIGIAFTGTLLNNNIVTTNGGGLIARCHTGLGPTGNDNSVLGDWYFNGSRVTRNNRCNSLVFRQSGASVAFAVGVINLIQCAVSLPTAWEGIYTCTMMNSSMMSQSIRLGRYFTGRSELFDGTMQLFYIQCMYLVMKFITV